MELRHRWTELPPDSPMPLLERRRVIGSQAMISHVTLHKGCDVPLHQHENEQFCCVLSGRLDFTIGAPGSPQHRRVSVVAGEVLHLPSNTPHGAFAPEETIVLDMFAPPSSMTGIDARPSR